MDNKSIIRVQKNKENPYAMIDKRIFSNAELSWKAKGLLSYLLSRPDNWKIMITDLIKQSCDGEKAVYSGLKELIKAGYVIREGMRDDKGKFIRQEYQVFEEPLPTSPFSACGFPASGKPACRKSTTNNTDVTKTDITNKEYRPIIKKPLKRSPRTDPSKYDQFYN